MKKSSRILIGVLCCATLTFSAVISENAASAASGENWYATQETPNDYAYSFAVVGDTQYVTYYNPDNLAKVYDYIVENVEKKNIRHVFGLGDITDTDSPEEWALAQEQISKLDGVVPYSLVRGNHDTVFGFLSTFGERSSYAEQYIASYEASLNTVHEFSVGNLDYLVVTLDYGASDETLAWANEVVASYPYHNVIVTTHAYLNDDGTWLDGNDSWLPTTDGAYNHGGDIWNKFIKKHENIVLIMSGHISADGIVVTTQTGEKGNTVTQMLIDPQAMDLDLRAEGGTGLVANLYFSADGKTVTAEYYSPVKNQYKNENFTFQLNTVEKADVKVEVEGKGKVTPAYAKLSSNPVEIEIIPAERYYLYKLEKNGVDVTSEVKNGVYLLSETFGEYLIKATFAEENKYMITERNDKLKGAIVYSNEEDRYYANTRVAFRIEPKTGYQVKCVTFNGVTLQKNTQGIYEIDIAIEENLLGVEYEKVANNSDNFAPSQSDENLSGGCTGVLSLYSTGFFVSVILFVIFCDFKTKNRDKDRLK